MCARPIARWRQGHKHQTLAQRDVLGHGRHLTHEAARLLARKREQCFDHRVAGKGLDRLEKDRAPVAVQPKRTLIGLAQAADHVHGVMQGEVSRVDQKPVTPPCHNRKAPQHGGREGFFDGPSGRLIAFERPVGQVGRIEQDLVAGPSELHDAFLAEQSPVEPHIVGAQSGRERRHQQQVCARGDDFQVELALQRVEVHRDQPIPADHIAGEGVDVRQLRNRQSDPEQRQRRKQEAAQHGIFLIGLLSGKRYSLRETDFTEKTDLQTAMRRAAAWTDSRRKAAVRA